MPANRLPAAIAYPVCIRQLQGKRNDTWCTEAPDEFDKKCNGGVALNHAQSIVALGIFMFLHLAQVRLRCRSPPPSVWIFTRHQTKKPTEDCLSPRKTTTIISVFSHKWWKRRGKKAPPFFFGAALDAGNRFFPSIESGKNR